MPNNVVELVVRLQDKLSVPLEQMNGKLESFGASLKGLTAVAGVTGAVSALAGFAKQGLEAADALGDAADRAGVAVESLSRLKYAATQSDVDFGSLTQSIKLWQVQLSRAASGQKDASDALKLLNLNAAQLKDLGLEEQLRIIADQFSRIRDPADQTRVAVELFGRAGEQLVPLLRKGGDAIEQLTAQADKLGITLDTKTAQAADRATKAYERLKDTLFSGWVRAVGDVAGAFQKPLTALDELSAKIERLQHQRDDLANNGSIMNFLVSGSDKSVANLNQQLDELLRARNALIRRSQSGQPDELKIPAIQAPITDVVVKQRKAELEGLAKLLDQFERDTRVSEDKIYQDYKDTVAKIQELTGKISPEDSLKRLRDARLKYENDVLIDPVKITQSKVVVTQVITEQQRAVNKFVDTLSTGLDNLARSGELTGKSILKYLLSAFEAQVLKDAISGLGSYLKKALGGTSGSSSTGSSIGSFINAIFGHAAGGGRGGPRVVGEDGPELDFGGGNIMNRRQLQFAMAGAGGGVTLNSNNVWNIDGSSSPEATAQYMEARLNQRDKRLLEQLNRQMKDSYGRGLR